jgi:hypothetical protein
MIILQVTIFRSCLMKFPSPRIVFGLTLGCVLVMSSALAQTSGNRQLILKTSPEDTVIELTGNVDIRGDGNIEATPVDPEACSGSDVVDPVDCDDVTVGGPTFRINGSTSATVVEGQDVSFSWESRGAWECQAGGNLPGWDHANLNPRSALDSRRTFSTTGLASETAYTASLVCSNGPVQSNNGIPQAVSLTVNQAEAPIEGCEGREPPAGWTRLTTGTLSCHYNNGWVGSSNCLTWNPGVWNSSFLSTNGVTKRLATGRQSNREYIALEFNTNGMSSSRVGEWDIESGGPGPKFERNIVTISTCPGDFNKTAIDAETGCYVNLSNLAGLRWGGPATSRACKLQPNTRYFVNILFTESANGTPTNMIEPHPNCTASGGGCGFVIAPYH